MSISAIEVSDSIQTGLDSFFGFLPNLLAFLVILVVGYFIAKIVSKVVQKVAEKAGLDKALHESDANQYVDRVLPGASPSAGIGKVFLYIIFLFVLTAAIGALKIPAVTAFMNQVLAYLPNVIAAIIIFVVAAAIAGAVAGAVAKLMGDTPTGKVVATAVPSLVMLIAVFMILNQLRIAPEIVTITYTALLFTVALASALAFGLGGRQVAADMLGSAYQKGQEQRGQVKADIQKGKERGQEQAERGKQKAQTEVGGGNGADTQEATGARRRDA
jgi:Conserved TM helix